MSTPPPPPEEGGTKIRRNSQGPPQQPPQQQPMQQGGNYEAMMMQQQAMQQQAMQQQAMQQGAGPQVMMPPRGILKKKVSFGKFDSPDIKNTILVIIIFLLLNSKIVWKQIIQFPFMGGVEPSIVALVVNSVLAGMIFYLVSNYLMKN
jgi:hypothetical protein